MGKGQWEVVLVEVADAVCQDVHLHTYAEINVHDNVLVEGEVDGLTTTETSHKSESIWLHGEGHHVAAFHVPVRQ